MSATAHRIGILSVGPFAHQFRSLFKAHPMVKDVFFVEPLKELRETVAQKFWIDDDVVQMLYRKKHPVLNVWTAARYCAPGAVAHKSALREGESLPITDFGMLPAGTEIMDLEKKRGKKPLDL